MTYSINCMIIFIEKYIFIHTPINLFFIIFLF